MIEGINQIKESRLRRTMRLGVALGTALAVVTVLMWILQGVSNAGALAATLYVDGATGNDTGNCQNPASPCDSIGYAISQAVDGDEILITAITYNENLTITGDSLTLIGGYTISGTQWLQGTGETIIDGNNAGRTLFIHGSDSVLDNLTITGGNAPAMECWGGGVWITNGNVIIRKSAIKDNTAGCGGIEVNHDFGSAHLTIESSTVSNNEYSGEGGGLHVWGEFASADIVDVEFIDNKANGSGGAISIDNHATANVKFSKLRGNSSGGHGGGIAIRDSASAAIIHTLIYSNTALGGEGGGLHIDNFGRVRLIKSWVLANAAFANEGGGIGASGGGTSSYIENSIIAGNTSGTNGGGLWLADNSTLQVFNSHIVGNETPGDGAAIAAKTSQAELTNTLIISNTGFTGIDDRDDSGSLIQLSYCDTFGNSPDGMTGVTISRSNCLGTPQTEGVDPLMAGGALPGGVGPSYALEWLNYDYHLLSSSPAIDSGSNVGAPLTDIDDNPRPIDGNLDGVVVTDIGAYEYRPSKVYLPIILAVPEQG